MLLHILDITHALPRKWKTKRFSSYVALIYYRILKSHRVIPSFENSDDFFTISALNYIKVEQSYYRKQVKPVKIHDALSCWMFVIGIYALSCRMFAMRIWWYVCPLCRQLLLASEIMVCLGILLSFNVVIPYSVPQYVCSGLLLFVSAEVLEGVISTFPLFSSLRNVLGS